MPCLGAVIILREVPELAHGQTLHVRETNGHIKYWLVVLGDPTSIKAEQRKCHLEPCHSTVELSRGLGREYWFVQTSQSTLITSNSFLAVGLFSRDYKWWNKKQVYHGVRKAEGRNRAFTFIATRNAFLSDHDCDYGNKWVMLLRFARRSIFHLQAQKRLNL